MWNVFEHFIWQFMWFSIWHSMWQILWRSVQHKILLALYLTLSDSWSSILSGIYLAFELGQSGRTERLQRTEAKLSYALDEQPAERPVSKPSEIQEQEKWIIGTARPWRDGRAATSVAAGRHAFAETINNPDILPEKVGIMMDWYALYGYAWLPPYQSES